MTDDTMRDTATAVDRGPGGQFDEETVDEILSPGTVLGRFIVHRMLGAGGAGVVYAAHDPELDRTIALKVLRRVLADQADARARFLREAQALARLSHPNVISVYDVGAASGCTFIAMEYIQGHTFGEWLTATSASWPEIVAVLIKAGRGLAAAHAAGLIHRDFKPANLLVGDDGRVVVTDFGLARAAMSAEEECEPPEVERGRGRALAEELTRTGAVQGTPAYMAPEQHRGQPADARADQFSFCVTLYEAVFRVHPFLALPAVESTQQPMTARELGGSSRRSLAIDTPRIPSNNRGAPTWLQRAVLRGLSVRPADRFASMDRLLAALNHEPVWRRQAMVAGGAISLVGLVIVVGLASRSAQVDQRCTGAAAAFAATWNQPRRTAIESAFAASRSPAAASSVHQVVATLDQYAEHWTQAHTATCRATRILGEQTESTLDLRMTCLERRRQEADALISTLTTADAGVVHRSIDAALGLLDVSVCGDIATLQQIVPLPADPAVRNKLVALQSRLAEADAKEITGSYSAGLAIVRPVVEEARALGYRPLEAEAAFLQGKLEGRLDDASHAETSLEAAVWAAEAGRHDKIAAQVWAELVFVVGNTKAEYARGLAYVPRVTAALARIGGDPIIEASLESALGSIDLSQSKVDSGIAHFEKALALNEKALGPDHPRTARALDGLAYALLKQGDTHRAVELLQRALSILERVLGPAHPLTARVLNMLGNAHTVAGDTALGEQELRRALELREAALGTEHRDVLTNLGDLSRTLRVQGRVEEALVIDRKQMAIATRVLGPDHPIFAKLAASLGTTLAQNGNYAEAAEHLHRAEATFTKLHGPDHSMVLMIHVMFADILIAQKRWPEAAAAFERLLAPVDKAQDMLDARQDVRVYLALSYIELHQPARALQVLEPLVGQIDQESPAWQGQIHFMQARALWDSGRDRDRARQHAAAARGAFERARLADERAKVERWLATHPVS